MSLTSEVSDAGVVAAVPEQRPPSSPTGGPTILFVLGTVRSGSTLLARLLGGLTGVAALGEVLNTWRALEVDDVCSCGMFASCCQVWSEVAGRVTAAPHGRPLTELVEQAETLRTVDLINRLRSRHKTNRQELVAQWRKLYLDFAVATGADVLVDTSKTPASLAVALETGLPVRIVHLVRDPRAVAFSEYKRGHWKGRRSLALSCVGWCLTHVVADQHPAIPLHQHLRYEDLMRTPREALRTLAAAVDLPDEWGLEESEPGRFRLAPRSAHDLAGNRMRKQIEIEIRSDDEWQRRLPRLANLLIALVTIPLRWRYGYRRNG